MKSLDNLKYHYKQLLFESIESVNISGANYAIAGGAIREYFTGDKIKDYDIFVRNEQTEKDIIAYFNGCEGIIKLQDNEQLVTFVLDGKLYQVIKGRYYNLDDSSLIDSFDYTICCAMLRGDGEFKAHEHFFEDCLCRRLRVNKITFPLASLERLQKYIVKGYSACNGTLLTLTEALQTVNLTEPKQDSLRFYPDGSPRFLGID